MKKAFIDSIISANVWVKIVYSIVTLSASATLYVAGFVLGLPSSARSFIDSRVFFSLTTELAFSLALAAFLARYIVTSLQSIIAALGRRGFLFPRNRAFNLTTFRFALASRFIRRRRNLIFILLGGSIFSFFLVGSLGAIYLLIVIVFFYIISVFAASVSQFRLSNVEMIGVIIGDYSAILRASLHRQLSFAMTFLLIFIPLVLLSASVAKMNALLSNRSIIVVSGTEKEFPIVAVTQAGLLLATETQNSTLKIFRVLNVDFLPFGSISSVKAKRRYGTTDGR